MRWHEREELRGYPNRLRNMSRSACAREYSVAVESTRAVVVEHAREGGRRGAERGARAYIIVRQQQQHGKSVRSTHKDPPGFARVHLDHEWLQRRWG